MNQRLITVVILVFTTAIIFGCASARENPVCPSGDPELTSQPRNLTTSGGDTHLWGYYEVRIDTESGIVSSVPDRSVMFTANVVNFLNGNPANLSFEINEIVIGDGFIDVDINVGITHPFPGTPHYHGYDVRGVFMGDGSVPLEYNPDLVYPAIGTDQFMLDDPETGSGDGAGGGPDGYTRWYNLPEFSEGGMPLFNYTEGALQSPGFSGTATLCPYKYYADSLCTYQELWTWLTDNPGIINGRFSSGIKNVRNYYLRFPDEKGVVYGYAVIADWAGTEPEYHPSNAVEAVGCDVADNSNVYFISSEINGGLLDLDISVFDWGSEISAGMMEDYNLWIESTVLNDPYQLDPAEMSPVAGNENFSTYHVEIGADNVTHLEDNEFWVIVEYPDHDYSNNFGVTNLADDDSLAAFFRYDLEVSGDVTNLDPVCDLIVVTDLPAEGWDAGTPVEFDASGSSDPDSDPLAFEWDFDGDGNFDEDPDDAYIGDSANPTHYYTADYNDKVYVKVTDGVGGESICDADIEVITHQSKNIELHDTLLARDIAIDHTNGDLIVILSDGIDGTGSDADSVRRYHRSAFYETSEIVVDALYWGSPDGYAIDMTPNQFFAVATHHIAGVRNTQVYRPDGTRIFVVQQGGTVTPMPDVCAFSVGDFENSLGNVMGYPYELDRTILYRYPYDSVLDTYVWTQFKVEYYTPDQLTGIDELFYEWIVAVETDGTGNYLWYLEDDPEFYVSRWEIIHSPPEAPHGTQEYSGAYFGTGSQSDDDDTWNDSRDLARDDQNRFFVLDNLSSGEPRVKLWSVDGNTTTSEGGFGDSTSIMGDPLAVEGSDWSGEIAVLHGDSVPYMTSVFIPYEMPD